MGAAGGISYRESGDGLRPNVHEDHQSHHRRRHRQADPDDGRTGGQAQSDVYIRKLNQKLKIMLDAQHCMLTNQN